MLFICVHVQPFKYLILGKIDHVQFYENFSSNKQVQLPGYLRSLPLPKSIAGFSELTREEWLELLPFFLFLIILLYLVLSPFLNVLTRAPKKTRPTINRKVKKDEAKVVDSFDIEDLAKDAKDAKDGKVAYCRCWKSKKVRN